MAPRRPKRGTVARRSGQGVVIIGADLLGRAEDRGLLESLSGRIGNQDIYVLHRALTDKRWLDLDCSLARSLGTPASSATIKHTETC